MQLVIVKFVDPTFYDYWASLEEIDKSKANFCYAAGWLLEDGDNYIKVGCIIDQAKTQGRSWVVIPQECVQSCDVIKDVDWEVEG